MSSSSRAEELAGGVFGRSVGRSGHSRSLVVWAEEELR